MSCIEQVLPNDGKLMALDVGHARIGIAVCDPLQLVARPLMTLHRKSKRDDFASIADIIQQEEVLAIVCGLPLNMDGSEGVQAKSVRKWAKRLAYALYAINKANPPILFWDERLSTVEANELATDTSSKYDDAEAAAVILQRYLDRQPLLDHDYGIITLPNHVDAVKEQSETAK